MAGSSPTTFAGWAYSQVCRSVLQECRSNVVAPVDENTPPPADVFHFQARARFQSQDKKAAGYSAIQSGAGSLCNPAKMIGLVWPIEWACLYFATFSSIIPNMIYEFRAGKSPLIIGVRGFIT